MNARKRLSAEERRRAILAAALPLFAEKGFNGTTTKEIARAAMVSEALLYRHFPSKDHIYAELGAFCSKYKEVALRPLIAEEPSTQLLVKAIHFMVTTIFLGEGPTGRELITQEQLQRLMFHSYLEDGAFARLFLGTSKEIWEPFLLNCIEAARLEGNLRDEAIMPRPALWFSHHLAVSLALVHLPEQKVIDYGLDTEQIVEQAVRFALRGLGLSDEAIHHYYQPGQWGMATGEP